MNVRNAVIVLAISVYIIIVLLSVSLNNNLYITYSMKKISNSAIINDSIKLVKLNNLKHCIKIWVNILILQN